MPKRKEFKINVPLEDYDHNSSLDDIREDYEDAQRS